MSSSSAVFQNSTEHAEVLQSDSPHCVFKMPTSAVYTGGDISSTGDDTGAKVRKPYTITKQRERWTDDEHAKFLDALKLYGRAWRHIEEHVGTKTAVQIRSHAQKFFSKIEREASNGGSDGKLNEMEIPPPRPKKKPNHPYPRKASTIIPTTSCIPSDATKTQEEPIKVAPQAVYSAFSSETKEVETFTLLKERLDCSGSPPSSNGSKTAASLQLFGKKMVLLNPKAGDGVNSKRKKGFSPYVQNDDVSDLMSSSGTYAGTGRSYSRCQIEPATTTLEGTGESVMTNASGFYPFQPRDTIGDLQGLGESDTNLDYMLRKRPRPSPSPRASDGSVVDGSYSNSVGFIAPPMLTNLGERFHHSMMMMMTMMPPWQLLQMAALGWPPGFVPPLTNSVVPPTNLTDSSLSGSEPTNLPSELLSYPPDMSMVAAAASAWWAMHGGIPPQGLYGGCNHPQRDETNIDTEKAMAEGSNSARWVEEARKEKQGREGSSSGSYSPPHENETEPVDSQCRATLAKAGLVMNGKKKTEKDDHGIKQGIDNDIGIDNTDNGVDNDNDIDNDINNEIDSDIGKYNARGIGNGASEKDIPLSHSRFHKGRFRPTGRGFVPYRRPSSASPKKGDAAKECVQRTPKP